MHAVQFLLTRICSICSMRRWSSTSRARARRIYPHSQCRGCGRALRGRGIIGDIWRYISGWNSATEPRARKYSGPSVEEQRAERRARDEAFLAHHAEEARKYGLERSRAEREWVDKANQAAAAKQAADEAAGTRYGHRSAFMRALFD